MTSTELADAERVAEYIRGHFPNPTEENGHVELVDSWSSDEATVSVVYRRDDIDGIVGLRIQVDPARPLHDEVRRILDSNVCEPLGSFEEGLIEDDRGIRWWNGEPAEWFYDHFFGCQE